MRKVIFITTIILFIGSFLFVLLERTYQIGRASGYIVAKNEAQKEIDDLVEMVKRGAVSYKRDESPVVTPPATTRPQVAAALKWNGPQLWEAVNKRRKQLGVNELGQRDELCTIASIRLNELLALGKLDGHEGFSSLPNRRSDLKWIYEKYNMSEFLLSGAESPDEAVSMWENTLGHKKLLTGGEYVWGCIYAQNTFAVAIAAY